MKTQVITALLSLAALQAFPATVCSPDGALCVDVDILSGRPTYSVTYAGKTILEPSPLGFTANTGDYTSATAMKASAIRAIEESYSVPTIKTSSVDYKANELRCTFTTADKHSFDAVFRVSDNDVAFRYEIPKEGETGSIYISSEATGFDLPDMATSFLCPQSDPMIGWKRTKPSYEEEYKADAPLTDVSKYGHGYTFPCLFKVGNDGWLLISETGVDSRYCASHLSDYTDGLYTIAYPMEGENNGNGLTGAAMALPAVTPWRTLTVGSNLKPIVETTVAWDVVSPLYQPSLKYDYGKGTWSWILWQDDSINLEDQKKYVDLAHDMGYKYVLVDNWWDTKIGRDGMAELARYARSRGVDLFVWYSSSGYWNDIEQGPVNHMDRTLVRKQEMKWLNEIGAKGIKVDFFGGDKQETMRLYEDILSDADDHGLMVIFHGCTLPRGWERMYPNYVGSEAVLASENMYFEDHFCKEEPFNTALHPFIRNTVGCMEFGGCFMNRHMSRDNKSRHGRKTTDAFQLATTILFQNPIQNFALTPNNLTDAPAVCMDFLRRVPTTWDETVFIDGYPGRYVVLARRHGSTWYIAGVNALKEKLDLDLELPMLAKGDEYTIIYYDKAREPHIITARMKFNRLKVRLQPGAGFVIETASNH